MFNSKSLGCFVIAALALSASSTISKSSDKFIPVQDIVKKHAGQFECAEFDASNDNCIVVGTLVLENDKIKMSNTSLINPDPRILATITDTLDIIHGAGCTDFSSASIEISGTDDANLIEVLKKALTDGYTAYGKVCVSYFKDSENSYIAKSTTANGEPISGQPDLSITFSDAQKQLRMMSQ